MTGLKLDDSYNKAKNNLKELGNEYRDYSESVVKGSIFYENRSKKSNIYTIIEICIAVLLFVMEKSVMVYIIEFLDGMELVYPAELVSAIYYAAAAALFCHGGYIIIKKLVLAKEKAAAYKVDRIATDMKFEIETHLSQFDRQIREAIEKEEDLVFEPSRYWQSEVSRYKEKIQSGQKRHKLMLQVVGSIVCVLSMVCAGNFLFGYIVDGLAGSWGTTSGYIVFISYMLLTMVLTVVTMYLCSWYQTGKKSKIIQYVMAGLFVGYQGWVVLRLSNDYQAFEPLMTAISRQNIERILEYTVFDNVFVSMTLVTLATVWMILATKFDAIIDVRRNGGVYTENEKQIHATSEEARGLLYIRGVVSTVAAMITASWMVSVLEKGFSFGGILAFLGIAVIWAIVYVILRNDRVKGLYGNFSKFLYLIHYVGYIIIVLSIIPEFGWGTWILLAIHFGSVYIVFVGLALIL